MATLPSNISGLSDAEKFDLIDALAAPVPRFPYGLFYQIEADRILLIACFHGKRNPRRWQRR